MTEQPGTAWSNGKKVREPKDFSRWGMSHERPEKPRVIAWRPGDDRPNAPIIAALRAAGFDVWIGSRREPIGNFEVSCMDADSERARDIILGIDPAAEQLTVGR
ncbi:hypothetical protein HMPREF0063_12164 [Aeromicrobium marinum DSM 15272]|uniref:Uncharacterized protein n=1 Tax=Aeromicrobium marinum DSM 15272 TaxID=585531 RepID=E2SCK2_9ACTN|nr:hypothetical protein [Aeromicrobium marinum]EFQ82955.1 hypothetical protein HMPREF0063_12164 [Aeromicrobium marinum DSM 15272]